MPSPISLPPAFQPAGGPTAGDRAAAAASRIRRLWRKTPAVGLILGSGLHRLADVISTEVSVQFSDLPGMLAPTATGHKGRVLCGTLAGLPVIACQGRLHRYEGHSDKQLRFPVRLFDELGCRTLVLSNAAGGVNPEYQVGDVMVVDSQVDLLGGRPLTTLARLIGEAAEPESSAGQRRVDKRCYDAGLANTAYQAGLSEGRPVRIGTYAAMQGPNYETRAEYRMLRAMSIDTVGMSTVPEADEAYRRGLRVLALSIVTNACDPDALQETSGEAVIAAAEAAEAHVRGIVWDVLSTISDGD